MAEVTVVLGVALVFVFGWNNSAFLIGNGRGSGALTLREALLISATGLLLGVLLQGSSMLKSLSGSLTPTASNEMITVSLLISLVFTLGLSFFKLPVSFSMVLVGAFAGAVFASSLPLNHARLEEVIEFWAIAPIATALLAYVFMKIITRGVSGLGLVTLDTVSRYAVIATSLVIAYVLGANNIGLIYGTTLNGSQPSDAFAILLTSVAIVGMVVLGTGGVSGTIGDRMLVLSPLGVISTFLSSAILLWLGTELAIPISLTQCLVGGMFGAAFSNQVSVVNTRLAVENIASWIIVPSAAFLLAILVLRV